MNISLDWLRDYVDFDGPVEEIAGVLSNLGFTTEGIEHLDDDAVMDIEVTSNRADCLSYIGIARELAAFTGRKLKLPKVELAESKKNADDFVEVVIAAPELCARYTARIIYGVKVGPAPAWMKKRLEAAGIRSINNIVDATNYAMMETGQPPHAFDFDKIGGGKIIVRKASAGERIVSIDETKCELDAEMLIIADEARPVAIAGVMGGLETEISETTTTILLEDAHFDPVTVQTTGRKLGISSEAAFRFERNVDAENIDWASQRTAQLIVQVAGGTVAGGVVDVYPGSKATETVSMRFSRLNKLLGIEIDEGKAVEILTGLGFAPVVKDGSAICSVPTWRSDVYRQADLIEEVARSYGYDNIPTEQKINIELTAVDKREKLTCQLRTLLNGCGFYETVNVTFVDDGAAEPFADDGAGAVAVKDESRKSANRLRPSLIGSLLGVLKANYNAGNVPCRIFELANTFTVAKGKSGDGMRIELTKLALAADSDFRDLHGVIAGIVNAVDRDAKVECRRTQLKWARAGAEIVVDGKVIGMCGIISTEVAKQFGLTETEVCAAELDFEILLQMSGCVRPVRPIPRFPAITRDLSLVVDEHICWADIIEAVNAGAPVELEDVRFTGIYRGKPIENGKKSVTISLRFRDDDGTLRHEVVDTFESKILGELSTKLNAQLRTV